MSSAVSRRVLKAMGLFGSVRMLQILFGVVRVKLVALWLGPAGVGLFGIFNNAVETVRTLAQLGVPSSSVRGIASQSSPELRARMVTVVRRWGWLLGLFGAVLMMACAPLLSRWTFGSDDRTLSYVALSVVIFLLSVSSAEEAVMQGLGQLRRLAKASVCGVGAGLAASIPMYYYWGLDSVVPSIIVCTALGCVSTFLFSERKAGSRETVTMRDTFSFGRHIVILGIYMTAADFITQAMSYVFIAYLNSRAGDTEVGFYQAGYTVVNRYVGMIFAAVATEYYPRISGVVRFPRRLGVFVAHEMWLMLLLLLPAVLFLLSLAPYIVRLLYDARFEEATPFISIAMAGVILRGISYCMSYVILAKGDGHAFIVTESISGVAGLALNIVCYREWGIGGLGVSYTLWYLLYLLIIGVVYRMRYGLTVPRRIVRAAVITVALSVAAIVFTFAASSSLLLLPVAVIVSIVSLRQLRHLLKMR